MKKNFKFKSEFLNEQASKGYVGVVDLNSAAEYVYKSMVGITGNCVSVMLFPNNDNYETYFYDKSLKNRMIYHLKKEGFVFSSATGQVGYYMKGVK